MIAPDVGGGFGIEAAALRRGGPRLRGASRKLGRPVKWTETRSEHMTATHHGRDQIDYVKVGAKSDGTITGLHVQIVADLGALPHAAHAVHPVVQRPS